MSIFQELFCYYPKSNVIKKVLAAAIPDKELWTVHPCKVMAWAGEVMNLKLKKTTIEQSERNSGHSLVFDLDAQVLTYNFHFVFRLIQDSL